VQGIFVILEELRRGIPYVDGNVLKHFVEWSQRYDTKIIEVKVKRK
jgi:hypothetical protein